MRNGNSPSSAKEDGQEGGHDETSNSSSDEGFPERIFAVASPTSVRGVSMFSQGVAPDATTVSSLLSSDETVDSAVAALEEAGFEVLQANNLMINIAGTREQYEAAFPAHLFTEERPAIKSGGVQDTATFIDNADTGVSGLIETVGSVFEDVLEGVAIEEPYYLHASTSLPPRAGYWHLNVPSDIALGLNAERSHRGQVTGAGVRVAMVDTGFESHPFFEDRGYRVEPTRLGPGASHPEKDDNGHGTGESANIFAVAPDATLLPVKAANSNGALVNVTAAFNAAAALQPHIVTNSWGSSVEDGPLSAANQALAAAVAAAAASGITVVFSAGNGGWGFPGQHPDVISVGGVYIRPDGSLQASDYASGFMSKVYPYRRVPDVAGLVGLQPLGIYIMLPIPPGCLIDQARGGGTYPNGDETARNDGWAAFSGTSAAAPQIAGVCALIHHAGSRLTTAQVRDILMQSARNVSEGTNHPNFGHPAKDGPDLATGHGLVDAHRAVLVAKLRSTVRPAADRGTDGLSPAPGPQTMTEQDIAEIEKFIIGSRSMS